jgi:hypothetical protein
MENEPERVRLHDVECVPSSYSSMRILHKQSDRLDVAQFFLTSACLCKGLTRAIV